MDDTPGQIPVAPTAAQVPTDTSAASSAAHASAHAPAVAQGSPNNSKKRGASTVDSHDDGPSRKKPTRSLAEQFQGLDEDERLAFLEAIDAKYAAMQQKLYDFNGGRSPPAAHAPAAAPSAASAAVHSAPSAQTTTSYAAAAAAPANPAAAVQIPVLPFAPAVPDDNTVIQQAYEGTKPLSFTPQIAYTPEPEEGFHKPAGLTADRLLNGQDPAQRALWNSIKYTTKMLVFSENPAGTVPAVAHSKTFSAIRSLLGGDQGASRIARRDITSPTWVVGKSMFADRPHEAPTGASSIAQSHAALRTFLRFASARTR